ncbi:hypothetical protein CR983_01890 [Candidatus Saccharibacteria bacterium]|nr:MAG: hypothetical protein CR983_01890 [Candidatus Saccharibacteria bacterium]
MQKITNIVGTLGYMSVVLQWMWCGATIVGPYLVGMGAAEWFLPSPTATSKSTSAAISMPGIVEWLILALAVVFALAVSLYAIYAVPKRIARAASRATTRTAKAALPHVTHHKPLSKARSRRLIGRIRWLLKAAAVVIALLITLLPPPVSLELDTTVVVSAGLFLALVSTVLFAAQYILARAASLSDARVI